MKQKEHLPIFGIGPVYVGTIAIIAIIGIILSKKGYLDSGLIPELKIPMLIIGIVVALLGVFIWGYAFRRSKIDDGILHNHLVTDGFIFWALMAIMLKPTEEKWLRNLYGTEYDAYCKRVNRTWPWFPKQY